MSAIRTGIVMDPIAGITPAKDSTLAMALEAQARGHELICLELPDLHIVAGEARGRGRPLTVRDDQIVSVRSFFDTTLLREELSAEDLESLGGR